MLNGGHRLAKIIGLFFLSLLIVAQSAFCGSNNAAYAAELSKLGIAKALGLNIDLYPPRSEDNHPKPPTSRCGQKLMLIVRGSNEDPSGNEQPNLLTYQQIDNDLFADSRRQLAQNKVVGAGYFGETMQSYISDMTVATLVYPASPIMPVGGVQGSTSNYAASVKAGADNFIKFLHALYDPCPDNPPQLVVTGYSQGADVINSATARLYGTPEQSYIEKIKKIALLGDPSRRVEGAENREAWIETVNTNNVGGVARAVTAATPYSLTYPSLDAYRDSHAGQIASYCAPGDLVCDTRSGESIRGVDIHTNYYNTIARISRSDIVERYKVDTYVQFFDALFGQLRAAIGLPVHLDSNVVANIGPGENMLTFARSIRDDTKQQKVMVRGVAYNGEIFEAHGTIDPGASGSVNILFPLAAPIAMDLEVYLDGTLVTRVPAIYQIVNTKKSYTTLYIQGKGDIDRPMGELLVQQAQDWNYPIEQRVEIIRSLYGDPGLKIYFSWLNFVYDAKINVPYRQRLAELMHEGVIPRLDVKKDDLDYIIEWLHAIGIIDSYGNLHLGAYNLLDFFDAFFSTN